MGEINDWNICTNPMGELMGELINVWINQWVK